MNDIKINKYKKELFTFCVKTNSDSGFGSGWLYRKAHAKSVSLGRVKKM